MEALLQGLIKSATALGLFYIYFKTLLSKETFFVVKRVYLIVGVLSSLFIPLVVITDYVAAGPIPFDWSNLPIVSQTPNLSSWDWKTTLLQACSFGVFLKAIRWVYQGFCVTRLIGNGTQYRESGYTHILVDQKALPFSFFNYIIYNPNLHSATDLETILKHEKEQCKKTHILDVVFFQLFLITQWFNSFAWLYHKRLRKT